MSKTVLIVGGGGFIGRHLAASEGDEVWSFDRNDRPAGMECGWIKGDVSVPGVLEEAIKRLQPDLVYYLCTQFRFAGTSELVNAWRASFAVIDELVHALPAGGSLVYLGSCAQYGVVDAAELPVVEEHRCEPVTDYGLFKHGEELHLRKSLRQAGKRGCFTRIFNVTGPGEPARMVGGAFAERLAAGNDRLVVGNLSGKRDFLDVRDVAQALVCVGRRGESLETYNICSGNAVSIDDYLRLMLEANGRDVEVVQDKAVGSRIDIPVLVGSNLRLAGLGWRPDFKLAQTIADLLNARTL